MTGAKRQFARATAVVIVLALCWPTVTAFAAATGPVQEACCMRTSHACHSHQNSGASVQAVCHACGWCHALPNAPAHVATTRVTFSFSIHHAGSLAELHSRSTAAPSRLHASRPPPRTAIAGEVI
jgi:hypothetical protein